MKGKTIATFALGAATGFVGLGVVAIRGMVKSKRVTKAIAKIAAEAFSEWVFKDRGDTRKDGTTIKLKNPTYVIHHYTQPCKILFTNRGEAEEAYNSMLSIANSYGGLSIRDYYDICGVEGGDSYTDTKYGWTKEVIEAHAMVVQEKMGYVIRVPDAKYLY